MDAKILRLKQFKSKDIHLSDKDKRGNYYTISVMPNASASSTPLKQRSLSRTSKQTND